MVAAIAKPEFLLSMLYLCSIYVYLPASLFSIYTLCAI
jgi:hypothetical protein